MRIVLVRHGRSGHTVRGWLSRSEFLHWREAYEAAGIAEGEVPPVDLLSTAAAAGAVVSSDAPRASGSANALAHGRPVLVSPLLRELVLTPPQLGRLRLPWIGWALAIGFTTVPGETERVREAAEWLHARAAEHGTVVAVTHGYLRRLVSAELVKLGYRRDGRRGQHHWSAWSFSR